MRNIGVLWFALVLILFISCKNKTEIHTANGKVNCIEVQEADHIIWKRYRCRGTCKEYTFTMNADGTVLLEAGVNMEKQGNFHSEITKQKVCELFEGIRECTESLIGLYNPNISDFQQMDLTISFDDYKKKIEGNTKTPECYRELVKELDAFVDRLDWKEVD